MGKPPKPREDRERGRSREKRSRQDDSRDDREQRGDSRRSSRRDESVRSDGSGGWTTAGRRRSRRSPPRKAVRGGGQSSRKGSPAQGAASLDAEGERDTGRRRTQRSPAQGAASGAESPAQGAALKDRSQRRGSSAQGAASADASGDKIPTWLVRQWRRDGRCFGCGSESHRAIDCTSTPKGILDSSLPKKPKTAGSGQGSAARILNPKGKLAGQGQGPSNKQTKTSAATNAKPNESNKRGSKRTHSPSRTGFTPKTKRPSTSNPQGVDSEPPKPRFSYAETAKTALTYGIVTQEGCHITRKAFGEIQAKMLKLDMAALAKNEWVPDYESWHYSLTFAKVSLADSKSAEEVCKCISNMGYVVKEIT